MSGEFKIQPDHLSKRAFVYVRQSSPGQVVNHPESARMQRELAKRAVELGWSSSSVTVLEGDQARSGQTSTGREEFKQIVGEVCAGEVGVVFGIDVSRLARNNADWFPLIEMCGLTGTLMADHYNIYDPNDPNDRLILGIRGTLSEAELVAMRTRLHGARWSLARRGELRRKIPTGYVWDQQRRVDKDPDERVRSAIDHFFITFDEVRSACALVRHYRSEGLLFPQRDPHGRWDSPVAWVHLGVRNATQILQNPFYAGVYFYGAHRAKTSLDPETRTRRTVIKRQPFESWEVLIQGAHPAYISWEKFIRNRERLKENRSVRDGGAGPARSGATLLQGVAYCGRCGRRLTIQYWSRSTNAVYLCHSLGQDGTHKYCMSASAATIDRWVEEQILEAIRPAGIEAAIAAVEELEKRSEDLRQQWEHRITQSQYEAGLAQKRYEAVDPANRLVAANLERDWEEKLKRVEEVKKEYEERSGKPPMQVTPEDRERVRELAKDIPRLWRSKKTKPEDRKRIVRLLIREVWLEPVAEPRSTKVQIHWQTGAVTRAAIERPLPGGAKIKTSEEVVDAVRELDGKSLTPQEIAEQLNRRGLRPAIGKLFTPAMVKYLCRTRKIGSYHGKENSADPR